MKQYFTSMNRQKLLMVLVLSFAFVFTSSTVLATLTLNSTAITSDGVLSLTPGSTGSILITSGVITGATTTSALSLSADSLTTGTGLYAASSSLTSGKLLDLQVSGSGAAASQTALNILTAGANATNAITTYGAQISNTHTNATSGTNVGLYLNASGATTANYGLIVNAGNVGIGTTTPGEKLEVVGNIVSKGTAWTIRTSAADNGWLSITYGNGLFVAVANSGTGNRVMTSPDGITWTSRTSPVDNGWFSVTYGNGLFVAVAYSGTGNRVMTSPDGITWTIRTSAADNSWRSVAYGNGLFVAVASSGTGNRVMTSPDGITWTIRTSAANNEWYSVTYGNGLFVAVANSGTGNRVMTSPDGITWTIRTSPANNFWTSVTYGNGLFVAVASNGIGNQVMTSPDGITWTIRTSPADNSWVSVTYGNGLFVAVATSGTGNQVMTSPDGINWTIRTSPANNEWYSVTYGNGLFVAVAYSGIGNRVMTSGKTDYIPFSANNIYQGGMNIFGNVGIGTTGPASTLTVRRSTTGTAFAVRNTADTDNTFMVSNAGVVNMDGLFSRTVEIGQLMQINDVTNDVRIGDWELQGGAVFITDRANNKFSFMEGNVGIGTTSPTAVLHLKAGTTAANTAPLKFTSGSLLTTAEAGAVEFLTDDYYATQTTNAVRRKFVTTTTGRATAQTAANSSVATYTLGAADASFEVSANVLVTTSSAENFTVTITYTDEGNTARTLTLNFQTIAGVIGTAINSANGAVPYEGLSVHLRVKASTTITMATTGTFTGATYNVEGIIKRI